MPFLEIADKVMIHYEEAGTGPPVVFVHGWGMSGRVWRFQEELADICRVITVDLRGHGTSTASPDHCGLAEFTADLSFLFDRLGLVGATAVGWSMGSEVALAAFPVLRERLAALILVGGTPRFTESDDYPHGLPLEAMRGLALRLHRNYQKTMGEFFRQMFIVGELTREQENRIAREIVMGGRLPAPETALATLATLAEADLRAALPAIDIPVFLIHGGADSICLPTASQFMAERLPQARLTVMDGIGHAPFLSRPAEFNELVRIFLRNVYGTD
jgi:pimeloyl-[acyl-carrier protein] methyl ester esterase